MMDKDMNADIISATNPAQVNLKRKKRKKKSGSIATDHDNKDIQIIEQTEIISTQISSDENHHKLENVEPDLEKSYKESLLDKTVGAKKMKKKKKRGMEDQRNNTNDMDMVDQIGAKSIATPVQEKDEEKRVDAEESKEGLELKNSLISETQGKDMAKKRSRKGTGSVSVKAIDEPKILDLVSCAQPPMDENVTADVDSVTNPTQVNSKRKKRKKKSNSYANDHDNNDTQITEQTSVVSLQISSDGNQNKVENGESNLAKADKEPVLVNENRLSVEPVVEKSETRKKKKRRMEDKNKDTDDVDMVDRAETMPITTHSAQEKDEPKKVDVVAQEVDEPKEGELKKKRQRKKKMKEKANDEHKLDQVVETDVENKKKGGEEIKMKDNAKDKVDAQVKDKIEHRSTGKLERGKGLFQRVKEKIRPLFDVSIFDDNTSSDDENVAPVKEEKKVISRKSHQRAETEVCTKIDEQNVEEKKDKPKEVNNKSIQEEQGAVAIDQNEQPKKKRKTKNKNKNKDLEANSENAVQTEDQIVQENEVNDKSELEKQEIVVIDKNEQPKKKKKTKRKRENKNLEPNLDNGIQAEDQTVDNLLMPSNLSVGKTLKLVSKRKLLVLDINGLLADVVYPAPKKVTPDKKTAGRAIFMRPYYIDFLNFCFERFDVGIWSSRTKKIIDLVVECLLGELKQKLLFCWDQRHCTPTKYKTLENKFKPMVFKELKKLWEKKDPNLPWEMGFYNQSNILLIDDSPYKALLNPKNTAIFPRSFTYMDKQDSSLGPGGDIRVYLEKLAEAENMQKFVEQNPFGEVGIDEKHEKWSFYSKFEKLRYVEKPLTVQNSVRIPV